MNLKFYLAVAAVATASFAMAQTGVQDPTEAPPVTLKVGDKAPDLKVVKWVKGKPITNIRDGGVHVVEFWATWCGPCKVSIPHLTELAAKYKGKADFTGVSVWEEESPKYLDGVTKFVTGMGTKMAYNVAADGQKDKAFMAKNWMTAAGQDGIPTAFVVAKDGRIAWIGHPMDGLDEAVNGVLKGTLNVDAEAKKQADAAAEMKKRQELMEPFMKAMSAQDTEGALLELDTVFQEDPAMEPLLASTKFTLLLETDTAKAYDYGWTLTKTPDKYDPIAVFNNSAWAMVDPDGKVKDPDLKLALAMAELAVKGTKEVDPFSTDTLAYIYFKMDNLDKAIELQTKAVALTKGNAAVPEDTKKEMADRLEQFKKAKAAK